MTNNLARYEKARRALAEARRVDEVKNIRDKAVAMQVYAKQAQDRDLINHATEIRLRAERRAGELLAETEKNKGTRGQGRPSKRGRSGRPPKDETPTLADLGVSKDQSSRWQRLAEMGGGEFEKIVARARQGAAAALDRAPRPKPAPKPKPEVTGVVETCVGSIKSALHVALSALSTRKDRVDLFTQVETAIRQIRAEAAGADHLDQTGLVPNAERWSG
jgi:hypothetical protein